MNSNDSEKEKVRALLLAVKAKNDETFKVLLSARHTLDQTAATNEATLSIGSGSPEVVEKVMQAMTSSGEAEESFKASFANYEEAQASWQLAHDAFVKEYGEEL